MIISSKLICLYRKYRVQNQAYEHLSSLLAAIKYMIKHNDSFLLFCLFLREIRTIQEQLYYRVWNATVWRMTIFVLARRIESGATSPQMFKVQTRKKNTNKVIRSKYKTKIGISEMFRCGVEPSVFNLEFEYFHFN